MGGGGIREDRTVPLVAHVTHLPFMLPFANDTVTIGEMSTMPVAQFVNVKEAAEIIGCTDGRVRQLLIDGTLQGIKATERAWLVAKEAAEKYRDTERRPGRKPA